jgi:excisionase family DNA binding protein
MNTEKLLTVRDVSLILNISEREVVNMAEDGRIPAYKVGGLYLRFKKDQVEEARKAIESTYDKADAAEQYPLQDKINDFLYFNDFYILSALIIFVMLFIIFTG